MIEYVFDPEGRGETPRPALHQFSALADSMGGQREVGAVPDGEDAGPELEEIEAMQGAQKQQLHLLTMDSLQSFLRDTLSHFVRIQEAATKGSQAQIEATIANMKLLSQQSTKLLESQLAAAQLTKERLEELQPQAAPPSFDLPGVLGSPILEEDALAILRGYPWPGNVRELAAVLTQAASRSREGRLRAADLDDLLDPAATAMGTAVQIPLGTSLQCAVQTVIQATLAAHGNNKKRTAEALGISRRTLYLKLGRS